MQRHFHTVDLAHKTIRDHAAILEAIEARDPQQPAQQCTDTSRGSCGSSSAGSTIEGAIASGEPRASAQAYIIERPRVRA